MHRSSATILLGAALALSLVGVGCKKDQETAQPGAELGGAGADGNNSAPDSLSNGGAEPSTVPEDKVGTPPPPAAPAPDPDASMPK